MSKEMRILMNDFSKKLSSINENTENPKKIIKESILGIAAVGALALVVYKIKKFVDKFAKFGPTISLAPFLSKIKSIENEEDSQYKIVVKDNNDYKVIAIVEKNGKVFDSLSVDVVNDEIYRGHDILKGKKPNISDRIIPMQMPTDANTENMEEINRIEDELVNELLEAIAKYTK